MGWSPVPGTISPCRLMSDQAGLPIEKVLPGLLSALQQGNTAVLAAEPGAGKTTRVPLALLGQQWLGDQTIVMLEPRRLAARSAARHMARLLGEDVGQTVGYRVRMDTRVSSETRIELVTEGVFIRMVQDDPALEGIGAVIFDEFHERSLDGDLGLALALDSQDGLRDDLRLLVMSATLDVDALADLLTDPPVLKSTGRSFPVDTRYVARLSDQLIEHQMIRVLRQTLMEETGSILAFLPGEREIRRVAEGLESSCDSDILIAPLYGRLGRRAQDLAVSAAPAGKRKVVLATDIAETSLTIDGVRVVVDSGLARKAVFDPISGSRRLETVRVSQASADQRRGRAGRLEPGVCVRLWHKGQTAALQPYDAPEILETDLSPLVLNLLHWGVRDPSLLRWLDPPRPTMVGEALRLLSALGLVTDAGELTALGSQAARLPLHPRLGVMVLHAVKDVNDRPDARQTGYLAAYLACLIDDSDLRSRQTDLDIRLKGFERDKSGRSQQMKRQAEKWLSLAGDRQTSSRNTDQMQAGQSVGLVSTGALLAPGYPDRVARRRGASNRYLLANGTGAFLPDDDGLSGQEFLIVADLQGIRGAQRRSQGGNQGSEARILSAAALNRDEIDLLFEARIVTRPIYEISSETGALVGRSVTTLGALVLSEVRIKPDPTLWPDAYCRYLADRGLEVLALSEGQERLLSRMRFVGLHYPTDAGADDWPDLDDKALAQSAAHWLKPYLAGKTSRSALSDQDLRHALLGLLPWGAESFLKTQVPERWITPLGSGIVIDYTAEMPVVSVRVQELYGLREHPSICDGRVPLTLSLLSPAGRPIQITQDLPGFWSGSWSEVAREMRGRYPKHIWPDDPATAQPTRRAKPRR